MCVWRKRKSGIVSLHLQSSRDGIQLGHWAPFTHWVASPFSLKAGFRQLNHSSLGISPSFVCLFLASNSGNSSWQGQENSHAPSFPRYGPSIWNCFSFTHSAFVIYLRAFSAIQSISASTGVMVERWFLRSERRGKYQTREMKGLRMWLSSHLADSTTISPVWVRGNSLF